MGNFKFILGQPYGKSFGYCIYALLYVQILPIIEWGKHIRVVLDVGCGVASFGGYLLEKDVITMSFAPKDQHEAQIQFALERGIPATLSIIGSKRLAYPDNVYDMIHCARCRVRWDADGNTKYIKSIFTVFFLNFYEPIDTNFRWKALIGTQSDS